MGVGEANNNNFRKELFKDVEANELFESHATNFDLIPSSQDQADFLSTLGAISKNTDLLTHLMEELLKESGEFDRLISRLAMSRVVKIKQDLE
jgi:cellulose biosynthesis protein BcsQ